MLPYPPPMRNSRCAVVITSLSAMSTARRMTFLSSRTLPGHKCLLSWSIASPDISRIGLLSSAATSSMKLRLRYAISSILSLSGGMSIVNSQRRKKRSDLNLFSCIALRASIFVATSMRTSISTGRRAPIGKIFLSSTACKSLL